MGVGVHGELGNQSKKHGVWCLLLSFGASGMKVIEMFLWDFNSYHILKSNCLVLLYSWFNQALCLLFSYLVNSCTGADPFCYNFFFALHLLEAF